MEQFDAKPIEIKALFSNALEPVQAAGRQAPDLSFVSRK
ncbi:phosphoribulokinase [Ralstonia solanacearum]|nr:phosphoribulokinase [Ralstonia solanacearum]MBT1539753.1 phosphoribulokinase [Ralstonia solanacearum]